MIRGAVLLLSALALPVGVSSLAATSSRPPPQPIAFALENACLCGRSEIAVVKPDGSGVRRLTHDRAAENTPAWSADHRRIAFSRGSFPHSAEKIWVMDADGSHVRRLSRGEPLAERQFDPAWSRDGKRIAISVRTLGTFSLKIVDVRTGKERTVATRGLYQIESPTWSPNGQKIAFDADRQAGIQIFVVTVRTGRWGQVTTRCREDGCVSPDWSPDGRSIAFVDISDGTVEAIDVHNGHVRTLAQGPQDRVSDPSWAPDGNWVSYDVKGEIWVAPRYGGREHRILHARPGVVNAYPDW